MNTVDAEVRELIGQFESPALSLGWLLCDRHAQDRDRLALRYEDAAGHTEQLTYRALADLSARLATRLAAAGVVHGDRVATLLPRRPELLVATLAVWRLGAVHVPLFTAFGPEAVAFRLEDAEAAVVITDQTNRGKLPADTRADVLLVDDLRDQLAGVEPLAASATTSPDDLMILIYTSGTTGHPKGVEVPVRALASFEAYLRFGLDVQPHDIHWNIADPGWAYGLYYGLIANLLLGKAILFYNGLFDPEVTYRLLATHGVTNLAAAPTVYRVLRASGLVPTGLRLRACASAGEPLNPDVIRWAEQTLGVTIHDQYGQTELGMAVINPRRADLARPIKPGSMGQAMPGFLVVIVDPEGHELAPGEMGELAIDTSASPLCWFRGYWREPEWTARRFLDNGRLYLTGDAASMDADGYVFFSSRADDVISSAGYRIGPFEVESSLMAHPAVAEAAAVGMPDALRGEVVKAFVVLRPGQTPTDALAAELREFVKTRLSAHAYPREVAFIEQLPRTPSGKVQRFLLRESRAPVPA
jgi:acetyl-CoA synthetase